MSTFHIHLGTLHCIMHNAMYIMQHAALFFLFDRVTASAAEDSDARMNFALIKA